MSDHVDKMKEQVTRCLEAESELAKVLNELLPIAEIPTFLIKENYDHTLDRIGTLKNMYNRAWKQ